jgi:hypothetical protein
MMEGIIRVREDNKIISFQNGSRKGVVPFPNKYTMINSGVRHTNFSKFAMTLLIPVMTNIFLVT